VQLHLADFSSKMPPRKNALRFSLFLSLFPFRVLRRCLFFYQRLRQTFPLERSATLSPIILKAKPPVKRIPRPPTSSSLLSRSLFLAPSTNFSPFHWCHPQFTPTVAMVFLSSLSLRCNFSVGLAGPGYRFPSSSNLPRRPILCPRDRSQSIPVLSSSSLLD